MYLFTLSLSSLGSRWKKLDGARYHMLTKIRNKLKIIFYEWRFYYARY